LKQSDGRVQQARIVIRHDGGRLLLQGLTGNWEYEYIERAKVMRIGLAE
jgi:hypothetical protein